jgi:DNA-binding beta-propeller fold protein YncE
MRRHAAVLVLLLLVAGCGGDEEESERQATATQEHSEPVLELPYDLAVDSEGAIYVADGLLHQVLRVDPGTGESEIVAGTGEAGTSGDGGPAEEATLQEPVGVSFAPDGSLLIADFVANRIRRVDPDGTIFTVAGTGREGWSGDGGPAERADLGLPTAVALDPTGRYVAVPTLGNYVRRIDLETGRIQTVAGDGAQRTTGEGGPAVEASVESPHGAAYDAGGNLYFPDGQVAIRRILADTGTIESVVEGPEAEAFKVLFAPDGTLYLVSGDPSGGQIKRLSEGGSIEVVVGTGVLGASDDGMPATEIGVLPSDIEFAPDGALLFAQSQPEPAVRRVDPETGVVTTILR